MTSKSGAVMMLPMPRGRPRETEFEPTIMGLNLLRLRAKHGLSQQALADKAGLSQADVSRTETGETQEPSGPLLKKLADAMGESVGEFWVEIASSGAPAPQTLDEFLASPLGAGVTSDEAIALRAARWPFGVPTPRGWYHALELLRSSRRS